MEESTIGDDVRTLYEFDWGDRVRTTDEIGDLTKVGLSCSVGDIADVAREDDDCEVRIIGFEET